MTGPRLGQPQTPWHLWVVGAVTLLFNLLGITSYLMTKLDMLDQTAMTAEQIAFMESYPAWATAFWALGVWGAFAGSVLLLFRSRIAVAAMVAALIGLVGVTVAESFVLDVPSAMRTPLPLKATIWLVTLYLLAYTRRMAGTGVLR
ncbi:hypothetical protein [Erythrobacter sp. WG]|uniref:hypothetical protein n=1 Tax=Erythrobacter sp. WG TaxID=2985510 RepID=UPI002271BE06|nr:hypothetical protein [Erythrobacter sp. WG]MCX9147669.1 hypothetical protein [Erythrobacter sp. WG]